MRRVDHAQRRKANAKSLMGVMMLVASRGSHIVLETDGPDKTEAMDAIVALIADGFGEGQWLAAGKLVSSSPREHATGAGER